MDASPPIIPADFWPKVDAVTSYRLPFLLTNLFVEIPAESEGHVLTAFSDLIYQQMVAAGEWAADADLPSAPIRDRSPQEISRFLVESAARLLSVYEGIYYKSRSIGESTMAPYAVKASAILGYQAGFVNQRHFRLDLPHDDEPRRKSIGGRENRPR